MMYDTTVCCSNRQLRVNPMNNGVDSMTCREGGLFHDGMGGRSEEETAFAASGKLSVIGGGASGGGFRNGLGFSRGSEGLVLREERSGSLLGSLLRRRKVTIRKRGTKRMKRFRRKSMAAARLECLGSTGMQGFCHPCCRGKRLKKPWQGIFMHRILVE